MSFSQRFGLLILILISISYVYFSFFNKEYNIPMFNTKQEVGSNYNPVENAIVEKEPIELPKKNGKNIRIFLVNKSGDLSGLERFCDVNTEKSCFEYAIKELILAPTKFEKQKGFTSEIPKNTRILSIRESSKSVMIDLSSDFESGGGAESTYIRIKQIIKTANANTSVPTYLYINGKQANVIGGEGIMIKQPLNERSFDE